jgi:hypothetical protein
VGTCLGNYLIDITCTSVNQCYICSNETYRKWHASRLCLLVTALALGSTVALHCYSSEYNLSG